MKSAIHRDIQRTERREAQLWLLTLGLLVLLGALLMLQDPIYEMFGGRATLKAPARSIATFLFGLVVLFSLYVINTLTLNSRLKKLLTEMGSLASSSLELDSFLPSIAQKIAHATMADTCQIVLFTDRRRTLRVRSAYADGTNWKEQIGTTQKVADLISVGRVVNEGEPLVLEASEIAELSPEDRELLTGGRADTAFVVALPLLAESKVLGLITIARGGGVMKHRFGSPTVALATTLASHAATAIDQAQLKRQAIHDPLTNLYNRRHLSERLRHEIAKASRNEGVVAVLLCDLDRFKSVNDQLGHQVGDDLLKSVAHSVKDSTRNSDLVFRWGGDEIVVVLAESTREGVLTAANRIREGVLRTAVSLEIDIDVSIGIARYPEHGQTEDDLIRTADRALYIAKKSGDHVRIGEEDYQLDRGSITVVFQPVVEMPASHPHGWEALSRDPSGQLTVSELFAKYRAIGRLKELKEITLRTQIATAEELGLERVFINADFGVLGHLDPLPKPPGMEVVIELSELEALTDLDAHLKVARRWREAGYKFALDDFGAGFISFPFLATLVPDYIKVDRSTMLQAATCEKFRVFLTLLLQAVRPYARSGIIAEGVEQESELLMVREMGVNLVQGFYFGRPSATIEPHLEAVPVQSVSESAIP